MIGDIGAVKWGRGQGGIQTDSYGNFFLYYNIVNLAFICLFPFFLPVFYHVLSKPNLRIPLKMMGDMHLFTHSSLESDVYSYPSFSLFSFS